MPRDLPVYGTAAGSAGDGAFVLDMGEIVDYVRRPAVLANNRRAYGLYVEGESMVPAHMPGDLILIDPVRPPRQGDRVVLVVQHGPNEPEMAYVKELVRRSPSRLELKQFNPPQPIEFDPAEVKYMHRVLTMAEVMGV